MCVYYESTAVKLCTDCVYRFKLLMKLLLWSSLEKVVEEVNILFCAQITFVRHPKK